MTQPTATLAATTSVEELVEQAKRLGLTWDLRPATVDTVDTTLNLVFATYDGDSESIPMINIKGPIVEGEKVMVMFVPPQGNYIIGVNGIGTLGHAGIHINGPVGSQSRASGYVDMTAVTFTFTKRLTGTRLYGTMMGSAFADGVNSGGDWGASLDGGSTTTQLARIFFNPASTHITYAGGNYISGIAAGVYTVTGRYGRYAGAANILWNADDFVSLFLQEVV